MDISVFLRGRGRARGQMVAGRRRAARRPRRAGDASRVDASTEAEVTETAADASTEAEVTETEVTETAADASTEAEVTETEVTETAADASTEAEVTEASTSTKPSAILINDMFNFENKLLDEVDKNLNSYVEIEIAKRIKGPEYDRIKRFVDETNDNLQRDALKIKEERVGKEVVGLTKGFLQSFRSSEKQSELYKSLTEGP